jgi:hypothetical protein
MGEASQRGRGTAQRLAGPAAQSQWSSAVVQSSVGEWRATVGAGSGAPHLTLPELRSTLRDPFVISSANDDSSLSHPHVSQGAQTRRRALVAAAIGGPQRDTSSLSCHLPFQQVASLTAHASILQEPVQQRRTTSAARAGPHPPAPSERAGIRALYALAYRPHAGGQTAAPQHDSS